jgi:hypothetical protein
VIPNEFKLALDKVDNFKTHLQEPPAADLNPNILWTHELDSKLNLKPNLKATSSWFAALNLGSQYLTEDESEISERVNSLVRRYLLDSSLPGNRHVLSTKGAHFTELSETFRGDYLQTVATIPFRAYVVYDQITGSDYEEKYLYLLSRLLTHRFIYSDRAEVTVVCEQNPRVALSRIAGLVSAAYESLEKKGSRRPICLPEVVCADKLSRQALSLSDAILWVFRSYALLEAPKKESSHKKSGELSERRFESIRHKIRLVLSLVSAEKFTLSKPFHPWQAGDPFVAQTRS